MTWAFRGSDRSSGLLVVSVLSVWFWGQQLPGIQQDLRDIHPRTGGQASPLPVVALPCALKRRRKEQPAARESQSALICQVSPTSPVIHTCGLRTLDQNHLGSLFKMQIACPGFPIHTVRGVPEAVFSTSPPKCLCAATSANCWLKAGGAGDQSRALGQGPGLKLQLHQQLVV